jgi:hypothetical protein
MRRIVVFEHLTLDGVMQAPGGRRLFSGRATASPSGVVIATYRQERG